MTTSELRQCEVCRKEPREWICVNFDGYIRDMCDGCFQELRQIHKQYPKRAARQKNVMTWLKSHQPQVEEEPYCELAGQVTAVLNAAFNA